MSRRPDKNVPRLDRASVRKTPSLAIGGQPTADQSRVAQGTTLIQFWAERRVPLFRDQSRGVIGFTESSSQVRCRGELDLPDRMEFDVQCEAAERIVAAIGR